MRIAPRCKHRCRTIEVFGPKGRPLGSVTQVRLQDAAENHHDRVAAVSNSRSVKWKSSDEAKSGQHRDSATCGPATAGPHEYAARCPIQSARPTDARGIAGEGGLDQPPASRP